ncbi:hypothetical protein VCR3J2_310092 [Vibrio coralliirubri]|nr:hypothetical protein VCR3J2_310092 [Vibrio coralliirubri]
MLDVRLLNCSGELSELTFLTNDTGTLRHTLVLLHVQGIVREENTMHPLGLSGGRYSTNVEYKDYALTSSMVGVGVAYEL